MASHFLGHPAFRFPHMTEHDGMDLWQGHPPDETLPTGFRLSLTRNWQTAQEARFAISAAQVPLAHASTELRNVTRLLENGGHDEARQEELKARIADLEQRVAGYLATIDEAGKEIAKESVQEWSFDLDEFR